MSKIFPKLDYYAILLFFIHVKKNTSTLRNWSWQKILLKLPTSPESLYIIVQLYRRHHNKDTKTNELTPYIFIFHWSICKPKPVKLKSYHRQLQTQNFLNLHKLKWSYLLGISPDYYPCSCCFKTIKERSEDMKRLYIFLFP